MSALISGSFNDLSPVHTVYGANQRYITGKDSGVQLHVALYHQHAGNARYTKKPYTDSNSKPATKRDWALGDRVGRINMLGLFLGDGASGHISLKDHFALYFKDDPANAGQKIPKISTDTGCPKTDPTALHTAYRDLAGLAASTIATGMDGYLGDSYVAANVRNKDKIRSVGHYETKIQYDRFGVRGALNYTFGPGFGCSIKGGVAHYSAEPTELFAHPGPGVNNSKTTDALLDNLNTKLMAEAKRNAIAKDLGYDFSAQSETGAEDTFVELYWKKNYPVDDEEGDHVVTLMPRFSCVIGLPTAKQREVGKIFAHPLGNDGFYSYAAHGELNFDFPGMIKVGFSAGGSFNNERNMGKQHVPTHEDQSGIYPWKTEISRKPGNTWSGAVTLRADHFVDYLTWYFDWVFQSHSQDRITILGDQPDKFLPKRLEKDSSWRAQTIHIGFDYDVTPSLSFGVAAQAVYSGRQVYKTNMLMWMMTFVF